MARLTFAYIVEPPKYEVMACLLVATIRAHWGADAHCIGYCPAHRWDELHPSIFEAHRLMGAEIRPMQTDGLWAEPYPHGNKIIAAMQPRETPWSAFVDSDVLFMRTNALEAVARDGHVSCSMAASLLWAEEDIWDTIYGALAMPVPTERYEYMRRPVGPRVPYFSSGLVYFPEADVTGRGRFGDVWYDTARIVDGVPTLENKRPYLDQMTLPAAIRRAGLDWNILPEEQHYILGGRLRGKPLPEDSEIFAIHYRDKGILHELGLLKPARSLLSDYIGTPFVKRLTEAPEKVRAVAAWGS